MARTETARGGSSALSFQLSHIVSHIHLFLSLPRWNETQIADEKVTIGNGMSQGLDGEPDEGGDAGTDAEDE